jgi:hypothetical protein
MPTDQNSAVPFYLRTAERRKTPKTFNIYTEHSEILKQDYKDNSSALIRFLMDKYFGVEHLKLKAEFQNYREDFEESEKK